MQHHLLSVVAILSLAGLVCVADCAAILVVVPTPARSHQMAYRRLWEELSLRGHDVTLLTTDPLRDASLERLREIDLGATYEIAERRDVFAHIVAGEKGFAELRRIVSDAMVEAQEFQMSLPEVRALLDDPRVAFDLVVVEAQSPFMLAFAWYFGCPSVAFSTLDAQSTFRDAVGDYAHPTLEPDFNLDVAGAADELGLRDRLVSFLYAAGYRLLVGRGYHRYHEQAKRFFGDELPPLDVLMANVSLLLHNTHALIHRPRASGSASIAIGGAMHIGDAQPLPQELQSFLDGAESGAVYFSLGGILKGRFLPVGFTETILKACSGLPYRFVLKMETEVRDVPGNVLLTKWAPQLDVLRHPAVSLFVSHGGMHSMQESLYSGIPVLGIPFFGDNFANVNRAVQLGYARKLSRYDVDVTRLREEIVAMMEDPRYKSRARHLSELYRHEDQPSLEKAAYWIEHVLKSGGAHHLRNGLRGVPSWKYYALDVVAICAATVCALVAIAYCAACVVLRGVRRATKSHVD